jgi:hypothetical protein
MSSALDAAELPAAEHVSLERRLFEASPFGTVTTAAIIFAAAGGGFVVLSWLLHYPLIGPTGLVLQRVVPSLTIALLLATSQGMRRFIELKLREDSVAFASIVSSDRVPAARLLAPPSSAHTLAASLAGAAVGAAIAVVSLPLPLLTAFPAIYAWQAALIVLLVALSARGVVMSSRTSRVLKRIIEHGLRIELLHADRLAVIGRQSARNALVWFVSAAIVCLFFVGGDSGLTTVPILIVCAAMGVWIFLHPMVGVHHRIRAAKTAELDRVRDEIGAASALEAHDEAAARRLPGLIAYEARIQSVREWPFDQSTLIRIAAYVLIPAVPWVGEALAGTLVQRLTHTAG